MANNRRVESKKLLPTTQPVREQGTNLPSIVMSRKISSGRKTDLIHSILQNRERGGVSPRTAILYMQLLNVLTPQGMLPFWDKAKAFPQALISRVQQDVRPLELLQVAGKVGALEKYGFLTNGKVDLTRETAVEGLARYFSDMYRKAVIDPTLDEDLREIIQFFMYQLEGRNLFSGNYLLHEMIGEEHEIVSYSGARLAFSLQAYSPVKEVENLRGLVQALIMNGVTPINSITMHVQADLLEKLFPQGKSDRLALSLVRDPLVFIPFNYNEKRGGLRSQSRNVKTEIIDPLAGNWAESLYDFLAPLQLSFNSGQYLDMPTMTGDFLGVLSLFTTGRIHPTSGFISERNKSFQEDNRVQRIADIITSGIPIRFADGKSVWNGKGNSDALLVCNGIHMTPLEFLQKLELLVRGRLNNNYQLVAEKVANAIEQTSIVAIDDCNRMLAAQGKKTLTLVEEVVVRGQIALCYSSWFGMLVGQYKSVIKGPLDMYAQGGSPDLGQMLNSNNSSRSHSIQQIRRR